MSYVIDITRERVKRALVHLGVEESELLQRHEEDFSGKGVSEEIQKLRYSFFVRKQDELLRQIKAFIRDEYLANTESRMRQSDDFKVLDEKSFEKSTKMRDKKQELIQRHLNNAQNNACEIKALEDKLKQSQKLRNELKVTLTKQQTKMIEFKQKQLENLKKINSKISKSTTPKINLNSEKFIQRRAWSPKSINRDESFEEELELSKKIQEIKEKMDKSKQINKHFIQHRKEVASKLLERSFKSSTNSNVNKESEYNEKLLKIVEKAEQADQRRVKLAKMQTDKKIKMKEVDEERRSKTRSKLDERERDLQKKFRMIEDRMRRSEYVLEKKHENWIKELEIRNELQRLKDEETLLNAERKKRASKHKREIILEKQLEDTMRIRQLKDERNEDLKKKMEIANKNMIEKEKLYESLCSINKLTDAKLVKLKEKTNVVTEN